jgi:light-regulated signal transduction histidine kinase (bacteriophytochrome)
LNLHQCQRRDDQWGRLKVRTERKKHIGNKGLHPDRGEDNGAGMDEETRTKIRAILHHQTEWHKTGMGLYLVDKVVRSHGSFIEIQSEKGKGLLRSVHSDGAEQVT